jgi:hypothetical protein
MAQHDYVIANGTGAAVRSDLNNALAAIVSQNSGATAPSPTYAYQFWADTTTGLLKLRNAANSAWITLFQLDGEWSTLPVENGTAAAPSIYFKDSGTDSGFFSPGTDQVGISTAGTSRLTIDSNGNVNIDSNTLYVDAANNRVGVGTSSPASLLTSYAGNVSTLGAKASTGLLVENNGSVGNVSQIGLGYTFSGTYHPVAIAAITNSGSGSTRADLHFATRSLTTDSAPDTRMIIKDDGKVGVGTTSPSATLDVNGVSYFRDWITTGTSSSSKGISSDSASRSLLFAINQDEKARIDTSGRLLVGTSSNPTAGGYNQYAKLVSQGNTAGSGLAGLLSLNRGEGASTITTDEEIGAISFGDSAGNEFGTIVCRADANAGSSDYPGRLVFSTTADGASSPTERLRIKANGQSAFEHSSDFDVIFATATNASYTSAVIAFGTSRAGGTSCNYLYGAANGTNTFLVRNNGDVRNTNGTYTTISDVRLKENIVDAASQWDDIKAIKVRNWNFKEETGYETHRQIGPIAQELETVCPGLVSESPDRDAEGNDLGTTTKSVNQSVLYMKAVKALQEAMERIEQLEAKVAALESA